MLKRGLLAGFVGAVLLAPLPLRAEGITIDHSAVGCMVAEQFPKLSACFAPASNLARARVYFRGEGGPSWYFVEMKSEAPCYAGVLPKPKKTLKKIEYYVEAVDKGFVEARTAEYAPDVVSGPRACKNDKPLAPIASKATVVVGSVPGAPLVPAGFAAAGIAGAGGVSAGVVAAGIAGAGAIAGGAVAASNGGNGSTTTTTTTLNPGPPPPTPTPTPAPTPTPPPAPGLNSPPVGVFSVTPDPPSGPAPLSVKFDMCASRDPDGDPLTFRYVFGDGATDSGGCRTTHKYTTPTLAVVSAQGSIVATLTVADDHGHAVSRSYDVTVGCPAPVVKVTSPANGANIDIGCNFNIGVNATATDPIGVEQVDFYSNTGQGQALFGTDTTAPYSATLQLPCCGGTASVQAVGTNLCGGVGSNTVSFSYFTNCGRPSASEPLTWTSQLDVKGARGQLMLNGSLAGSPGEGRSTGLAALRAGENRVEGELIEAKGGAGTWRIEFGATASIEPGSLRVVGGHVVEASDRAVVFRLEGRVGERFALTFRLR